MTRLEGSLHMDVETREAYWVSGVKRDGSDRHWAGGGKVWIEKGAVESYLEATGAAALDSKRLVVIDDLPKTDISGFHARANDASRNEMHEAIFIELGLATAAIRKKHARRSAQNSQA